MSSKFHIKDVPYVKEGINLCLFQGFSCFGCCGYDFKGKQRAADSFHKQTRQFQSYPDTKFAKVEFRERTKFDDLNSCNFCKNLILKSNQSVKEITTAKKLDLFCPLHPALNNGSDLRAGHCDTDYMCNMQIEFHNMDKHKKQKFLAWLRKRIKQDDIDWYSYSVNMDTDVFYKEYRKL